MKKAVKWIGIILFGLVVILLAGGAVVYGTSSSRLNKGPDVAVKGVAAANGAEAAALGSSACQAQSYSGPWPMTQCRLT